jgi:hypothetical protein
MSENTPETYKRVFSSLRTENKNVAYIDGLQWWELVEESHKDHQKKSVLHAITAIALSRWH